MRTFALFFVVSLVAAPAQAQHCTEAEARAEVMTQWRAWSEIATDVTAATDLAEAHRRYEALASTRCGHALGAIDIHALFDSWRALRSWLDRGGNGAIEFLLTHAPDRAALLPDVQPIVRAETLPPTDALRPLLCRDDDAACLAEGAVLGARARDWLAMHDELAQLHRMEGDAAQAQGADLTTRCTSAAMAEPAASRYARFVSCIRIAHSFATLLPDAPMRAPTTGWLVMRGRRGHYGYCDEVRAYDLATGAAYVASTCDGLLGLGPASGPVDHDEAGRVPIAPLRELAAFLVLSPHATTRQIDRYLPITLPAGIQQPVVDGGGGFGGGSGWGSSAQTTLAWAWTRGQDVLAEGTLTWPDSDDAREAYADHMVQLVEAGWVAGCAPVAIPRGLRLGTQAAAVSPIDVAPEDRAATETTLESRLTRIHAPRCR